MAKKRTKRPKAKKTAVKAMAKKSSARPARAKKAGPKVKKPSLKKKKVALRGPSGEILKKIGEVTHYFPKVKAAAVMMMKGGLKIGDSIYIKGHTTDFKERVTSIQLDRVPIKVGTKGDEIGLLVKSRVRTGDSVYLI